MPDRRTTIAIFLFSFLTGAAYVMMRAVAVSLFLSRVGPDHLPMAFAASAAGVVIVSLVSKALARLLSTRGRATLSWIGLAGASVLLQFGCANYPESWLVVTLLYVLADIRGSLGTIYLATLSSEQFVDSKTKRPFTIVASGAPMAGIVVGLALGLEASTFGVLPVLIAVAAVDLFAAVTAYLSPMREEIEQPANEPPTQPSQAHLRLRQGVAAIFALQILVLTLITYQWEVAASSYFGNNETGMVAYFAYFFAVSDLLIVVFQWTAAGPLLDRFGLRFALCGFPVLILLVGVVALGVDSSAALLIVYTLAKGMCVFRRSVHDPAFMAVYSALNPLIRSGAIVLNKGIIKPVAEAVAIGLLLLAGAMFSEFRVTGIWLALVVPWLYVAFKTSTWYRLVNRRAKVAAPMPATRLSVRAESSLS